MFIEVPKDTNLILNDTGISDKEVRSAFAALQTARVAFQILSAVELTEKTNAVLRQKLSEAPNQSAILLPGAGAKSVASFLSPEILTSVPLFEIPTSRTFIGSRPARVNVTIPESLLQQIESRVVNRLVIVDDVVASGLTVNTLQEEVTAAVTTWDYSDYDQGLRFSFPKAVAPPLEFSVVCWLLQQSARADLPVASAANYTKKNGKAALNSLSTWMGQTPKSQTVTKEYAGKYFSDPTELIAVINYLLALTT